jgi:hypothetical protein
MITLSSQSYLHARIVFLYWSVLPDVAKLISDESNLNLNADHELLTKKGIIFTHSWAYVVRS